MRYSKCAIGRFSATAASNLLAPASFGVCTYDPREDDKHLHTALNDAQRDTTGKHYTMLHDTCW